MNKIILYTTGCPQCKVIKRMLDDREISYETVTDEDIMQEKGFVAAPMLEVDGKIMNAQKAFEWLMG